jgi:hypothetical protein
MPGPDIRRCRIRAVEERQLPDNLRCFYHPVGKRPYSKTAKAKSQKQNKDRCPGKKSHRAVDVKKRSEECSPFSRQLREKLALCQKSGSYRSGLLEPRLSQKYLYM